MKLFYCHHCQSQIFFENYQCQHCQHPVGYIPEIASMSAFEITAHGWVSQDALGKFYKPCLNYRNHNVCNWVLAHDHPDELCSSCQLTEVIPNLHEDKNIEYWSKLETAKRRFLYMMQRLHLFPRKKSHPEDRLGLSFHFLIPTDDQPVLTGHANGVITLNAFEADLIYREKTRLSMGENYRTLLGHFRHESGHYYFDILIQDTKWITAFRQLFGDERLDYAQALQNHYENGPQPDWQEQFISTYASSHPWEDWAESWAHYLHMNSTLDTAFYTGMTISKQHAIDRELKFEKCPVGDTDFQQMIKNWFALTYGLNALNRSMGLEDAYPFTLSPKVLQKIHFIHRVVLEVTSDQTIAQRFNASP